jgi:hypothetical protein
MRGVGGKPGWFWLFVLMGGFTILSGCVLGFCLPDSFKNPHSTFAPKWDIFTEREIYILNKRVKLDDPAKGKKKKRIGLPAFKKAVRCLAPYGSMGEPADFECSSAIGGCGAILPSRCAIMGMHCYHVAHGDGD